MLLELKTELNYCKKLFENEHKNAEAEMIEHALKLIKIINDRYAIAYNKDTNAPAPEARQWHGTRIEYEALEHLESLYNDRDVTHWGGEGD